MITLSVDVTKLDKARFKEVPRKSGGTAKFAELVIFTTKTGAMLVKQQVTKEEREAGLEMPILGNAKDWDKKQPQKPEQGAAQSTGW